MEEVKLAEWGWNEGKGRKECKVNLFRSTGRSYGLWMKIKKLRKKIGKSRK